MRLPPRWVRRVVFAPAVVVLAVALVLFLPLVALVLVFLLAVTRNRLRTPRVLWMAAFYLLWDAAALVCLFGLWVASGFGWKVRSPTFQRLHYELAGTMLRLLFLQARWVLRLRITLAGATPMTEPDGSPIAHGRPLIVASRHAGPGDSFILVHVLINQADREPRIVLKDTLQWDPAVDILLNRLPNRFITPRSFTSAARSSAAVTADDVGRLAAGMDDDDAFLIFPEGGNFTSRRREERIAGLERSGHHGLAQRATHMEFVMAPRPGGMLAAMEAAPDADVLFIAHTGLDRMVTVADIWRELPMDKEIVMRGWHVRREDFPAGWSAREQWVFDWFERMDAWIGEHRDDAGPATAPATGGDPGSGEPPPARSDSFDDQGHLGDDR